MLLSSSRTSLVVGLLLFFTLSVNGQQQPQQQQSYDQSILEKSEEGLFTPTSGLRGRMSSSSDNSEEAMIIASAAAELSLKRELAWAEHAMETYMRVHDNAPPLRSNIRGTHVHSSQWLEESKEILQAQEQQPQQQQNQSSQNPQQRTQQPQYQDPSMMFTLPEPPQRQYEEEEDLSKYSFTKRKSSSLSSVSASADESSSLASLAPSFFSWQ